MPASDDTGLAIRAEGIAKRYVLGSLPSTLLSERLGALLSDPRSLITRGSSGRSRRSEEFWALRDVNLEVKQGEVLGLIGRNGAGKSTLLKILSRITPPTSGRALIRGRVGTLLEVGTGFHPELTGRENIFLNGAVLGMRRREILAKYADIVEFAGVQRFLETPVKRYSSGMHVRLAFSVAAHLEPEILMVDEVLAVGDVEFQRKCLGKMRDVAAHGRTVLFVSHNLGAIRRLCNRAVFLDRGEIVSDGSPTDVVTAYMDRMLPSHGAGRAMVPEDVPRNGTGEARLVEVALETLTGESIPALHLNQRFRIAVTFDVAEQIDDAVVELGISTFGGDRIVTVQSMDGDRPLLRFPPGRQRISAELMTSMLPGEFAVDAALHRRSGMTVDHVQDALRVTAVNAAETGNDHYPWSDVRGYVRPNSSWTEVDTVDRPNAEAPALHPAGDGRLR